MYATVRHESIFSAARLFYFALLDCGLRIYQAKQEQTEDLYIDRVLHESATETAQASLAPIRGKSSVYELAMDEVEDVEDRAALKQTAKEQKTVQQEMSDVSCQPSCKSPLCLTY